MKLISAIIEPFKNELLVSPNPDEWYREPVHPKPQPRGKIDDSGFGYRHDGLFYLGKRGESIVLNILAGLALIFVACMVVAPFL